jgi:hypothetical protein
MQFIGIYGVIHDRENFFPTQTTKGFDHGQVHVDPAHDTGQLAASFS